MFEFMVYCVLHVLDKSGLVPLIQWCCEEIPYKASYLWNWYFRRNPLKWFDKPTSIMIRNHTIWSGRELGHLSRYIPTGGNMILSTYDSNWVIKPNLKQWLKENGPNKFEALIDLETGNVHIRVKFAASSDAVMCRLLWSA